jgi:hypothetical protein
MRKKGFLTLLLMIPMWVQAEDFTITIDRKKDAAARGAGTRSQVATSQQWVGEIKIENRTFKPSAEIELRYIIFVKRQELRQSAGMDQIEQVKGTVKVGSLQGREKASFLTSEVTLRQQAVKGNWILVDNNGKEEGKRKAEDAVTGVWVKLFAGETEVADYANPSTVKAKNKWE